ncbi:MAG: caspase family protein [Candidatus Electrothrix sp. GW3-4]|uniref:caspase family protein n=1 Tax=Candidatus Electrothrix sp. GW3-4 TaxID=3126740 RepID=UPI0030D08A41
MKRALVAIGVDKTGGNLPILNAAADGASKITAWATNQGFDTSLITDKEKAVTLTDIYSSIYHFVNKGIYDQLIVYFSGHGFLRGSNYEIWLLSGAPENSNEAINVSGSIDLSRNCGISNIVFISDACRSIPNTIQMNYISGGVIFPAQAPPTASTIEVDIFYATTPGNPALEAGPDEAVEDYRGIFTNCLLEALRGKVGTVIQEIEEANGTKKSVIASRALKNYLPNKVADAASGIDIKLEQYPEVRVESDCPPSYLGEAEVESVTPSPLPRVYSTERTVHLVRAHYRMTLAPASIRYDFHIPESRTRILREIQPALNTRLGVRILKDVRRISDTRERQDFEAHTGFNIRGAKLASAITTDASCRVFEESNSFHRTVARIPRSDIEEYSLKYHSIVMRFDTGRGICLAVLPGYIGTVIVAENGHILSVNYTPAQGTTLYNDYQEEADSLEYRRAFAAVRTGNGSALDKREVNGAVRYFMKLKAPDPTLGIFTSYSCAQVGLYKEVKSIYQYMRECSVPIPFDIAMFANRNNLLQEDVSRYSPAMPMLAQGWALLGAIERLMHPAVLRAQRYLIPSLWSTFSEQGINILESAITSGELQ